MESLPSFRYRARAGWSNGPWSLTGFMNFQSHFFHTQNAPPNVNGDFCAANGGLDEYGNGGTYTCAISDYTNILPSYYTFDLSLGYNTMDGPANEYLRNIGIQLVVQNIMDRQVGLRLPDQHRRRQPVYLRYPEQHPGPHHLAHRHQGVVTPSSIR